MPDIWAEIENICKGLNSLLRSAGRGSKTLKYVGIKARKVLDGKMGLWAFVTGSGTTQRGSEYRLLLRERFSKIHMSLSNRIHGIKRKVNTRSVTHLQLYKKNNAK